MANPEHNLFVPLYINPCCEDILIKYHIRVLTATELEPLQSGQPRAQSISIVEKPLMLNKVHIRVLTATELEHRHSGQPRARSISIVEKPLL